MSKVCKNCGSPVEESYNNCPNCGAILEQTEPNQVNNVQMNNPQPQMNEQQNYNQMNNSQPQMNSQQNYNQMNNPQPQINNQQVVNNDPNAKSKMAAGLLGIFLGAWGIHNFYLGNTGRGVAQIILTLVTCGIASLWGFIEGILILCGSIKTDAQGRPLRD